MSKKFKKNVFYDILIFASTLINKIFKDKKKLLVALIIGLIALLILKEYKNLFILIILISLGAISMIYVRYFHLAHYIGFELCMMSTVIATLRYGSAVGSFVGFTSITGALVLSGYFKPTYFVSVLALPLIALIVPFFSSLPLWQLGLLMTLIYDAIVLPLYVVMGSRITSSIVFFITHIIFNYWIFRMIAPVLLRIIS